MRNRLLQVNVKILLDVCLGTVEIQRLDDEIRIVCRNVCDVTGQSIALSFDGCHLHTISQIDDMKKRCQIMKAIGSAPHDSQKHVDLRGREH